MVQESKLDFAYKYPFSQEAREVITELKANTISMRYLQEGVSQLASALKEGRITHDRVKGITEVKYDYIMGYVYARMLVSALGDRYSISRFAAAEAAAAKDFLSREPNELLKIANELDMGVRKEDGDFAMSFERFVSIPKKDSTMRLINQRLVKGIVLLSELQLRNLAEGAIEKEISERLPIDRKTLPKEVIEAARGLKPQEKKAVVGTRAGAYSWIEKLLANPIADVRHRSVNLIFAPYLVNVKGMDEESAAKLIIDYIEKCKRLNPNTKINEPYIRYQCKYAKKKGLRPLSLVKARELLKEVAEFE